MLETKKDFLSKELILTLVKTAKRIRILGANPFVDTLVDPKFSIVLRNRAKALFVEKSSDCLLRLYIESEQEDFYQQLTDVAGKANFKMQYIDKKVRLFGNSQYGEKKNFSSALQEDVVNRVNRQFEDDDDQAPKELIDYVKNNIVVKQLNLRLPFFALEIDDKIWYCPLCLNVPQLSQFLYLDDKDSTVRQEIIRYFDYLMVEDDDAAAKGYKPNTGGQKYTSVPNSELIEAYDELTNKRVAIFDRNAFLTLEYKRASIWGFIFNRKGQLLLQKRSSSTKDNRAMWDKSTGGHVDLTDASTVETAKREFIEEIYMKDAEYSDYNSSRVEMVVDFGEWRRKLRNDETFLEAFKPFTGKDKHVIMFRAFVEADKEPLTVDRDSFRVIVTQDNKDPKKVKTTDKPTRFRSDVFFFITAEDQMDTEEQKVKLFKEIENSEKGAAMGHDLVDISTLRDRVLEAERNGEKIYTDDLVHIVKNYWSYLTEFSSFVKDIFGRISKKG